MTLRSKIVAYWNLTEESGVRADSTGRITTLAEVGTVASTSSGTPGGHTAADFNAAGNFNAPDETALLFGSTWSLSFWTRRDGNTSNQGFVTKRVTSGAAAGSELAVIMNSGVFATFLINAANGNLIQFSSGQAVASATWQHWVVCFNRSAGTNSAGRLLTYLNGTLVSTANLTSAQTPPVPSVNATPANKPLLLGANTGTGERFDGAMGKVGLFNDELTEAEILRLYNEGAGLLYAQTADGGGGAARNRSRSRARATDPGGYIG
jgi:hypothetical protein